MDYRCKTYHAEMGYRYSGSVPEGKSPVFLQAMGRSAKEEIGAHARRSHVGRDAGQSGVSEGVKALNTTSRRDTKLSKVDNMIS